ncbi:MAG: SUMF1/EgtB/PvdO family nonheme iron enzyme [Candidatus Sumerlaeia bacterium]
MGSENLTLTISPTLLEAMGIREQGPLNYFKVLGVRRDVENAAAIDRAVMDRSRALRQWQTSPQYGREVVKLLAAIHRAATILKDPDRRNVYREELQRSERGETRNVIDEFADLVRAALADGQLDLQARAELNQFAQQSGISPAQAQQVIKEVGEKLAAARSASRAEAAPAGGAWEFRIAEQGEDAFQTMLHALQHNEDISATSYETLLAEAARYGVSTERAAVLLADFQKLRYRNMVRLVAHGHIVTEAQTRILLPKAAAYGLDQAAAFEIISDYTLSVMTPDDILASLSMANTFDQDEIEQLVKNRADKPAARGKSKLQHKMPPWLGMGVLAGGAVFALVLLAMWLGLGKNARSESRVVSGPVTTPTPAETAAAATPTPEPTAEEPQFSFEPLPEPASGFLAFEPTEADDPAKFEIMINEVTCAMYAEYIRATLSEAPAGWEPGGRVPAGADQLPVTNVTCDQAMAFANWYAGQHNFNPASVRLPSAAEYARAMRGGRTTRGDPTLPNYWARSRLGQRPGLTPSRQEQFDKIFIPGVGQIYDLVGNAAEWGSDERDGKRIVLGGDYTRPSTWNHLEPSWQAPGTATPTTGFRLVHVLGK